MIGNINSGGRTIIAIVCAVVLFGTLRPCLAGSTHAYAGASKLTVLLYGCELRGPKTSIVVVDAATNISVIPALHWVGKRIAYVMLNPGLYFIGVESPNCV